MTTAEKLKKICADIASISTIRADIKETLFNALIRQHIEITSHNGTRTIINMPAMQACFEESGRWPTAMDVDQKFDIHEFLHSEYPSEREYQAFLILECRQATIAEVNLAIRKFILQKLEDKQKEFKALVEP